MSKLVTRAGLTAYLSDLLECNDKRPTLHQYLPCFRSLDGRVPFCITLSPAFGCMHREKLVRFHICNTYSEPDGRQIRVCIDCNRWEVSVVFFSDSDDGDEFEMDIPEYAKRFRKIINPCDESDDLFSMNISDHPGASDIDRILNAVWRIQLLKQCGCGNPVSPFSLDPEAMLCVECQLTMPDDPDEIIPRDTCPICQHDVVPSHISVMQCCGVVLHKGCRQEIERHSDRCVNCRGNTRQFHY